MTSDAAVAEELIERMGARAVVVKMVHGMLAPLFRGPRAAGRDLATVRARIEALVDRLPVTSAARAVLERTFSGDELVAIRDFYRSPIGARVAQFAVDEMESLSALLTRWALTALVVPLLRSAGVEDRELAQMGFPPELAVVPADWSGVDDALRADAIAAMRTLGFDRRIDALVEAQRAQVGAIGERGEAVELPVDKQVPLELAARLYAAAFSRDELAAVVAFYATPLGQRTVELGPMLERAGAEAMQEWIAANPGALENELNAIAALVE
jgi:hypothetical protein